MTVTHAGCGVEAKPAHRHRDRRHTRADRLVPARADELITEGLVILDDVEVVKYVDCHNDQP